VRLAASLLLVLTGACRREAPSVTPAPTPTPTSEPVATAPKEPQREPPTVPDDAFAVVNGVALPFAAFHAIYDLKVAKYHERGREIPASADRRYRKSISERLIYHELLRQAAEKIGAKPDPAVLAKRDSQQRNGISDWAQHLKRRGETEQSLRDMYEAEERERLLLTHSGALAVTPDEIEARYQEMKDALVVNAPRVRASHILVPHDTPNAERRAKEIHARAKESGADFAALARETSSGPSADEGGDIGIFSADRMEEKFSAAAFAMNVGEISKPVRTKFGWHIIKVTGKFAPGPLPKSAMEDEIKAALSQRKLHASRRELKEGLLAKATIVDTIAATLGPEPPKGAPVTVAADGMLVGIAECDAVVRDWTTCVTEHRPPTARGPLLDAINESARTWRDASASEIGRETVRSTCLSFRSQVRETMTSFGCTWPAK
jgi:parvulin-like peptidyl-prolyl isomerase